MSGARLARTGSAALLHDPPAAVELKAAALRVTHTRAGVIASVSVHPLELARTRQALGATHGSALAALGDIVRAGGPRALFKVRACLRALSGRGSSWAGTARRTALRSLSLLASQGLDASLVGVVPCESPAAPAAGCCVPDSRALQRER